MTAPGVAPRKKTRLLWIVAAVVLLSAVGGWLYLSRATYHLEVVDQGHLYRCGLQSFREFQNALRQVKPKTIVSLIDDRELADTDKPQFKREIDAYSGSSADVKVVRIPVKLGGWPQDEEVSQFLAIAQDPARQPVIVHCAQGVRRTGMMAAAYQMSVLGYDKEKAKSAVLTFGHSERTSSDVTRFIDNYDPQARRMTATLPASKE